MNDTTADGEWKNKGGKVITKAVSGKVARLTSDEVAAIAAYPVVSIDLTLPLDLAD